MSSNTIGIMKDVHHPIPDTVSIFKVHQSRMGSFLYSVLAALYSNSIDRRTFHNQSAVKIQKIVKYNQHSFSMKHKHIFHFFKNIPKLHISIGLSVAISSRVTKIFNYKTIGKLKTS